MEIKVKRLSEDDWNRPRVKNTKTGSIYVNIDLKSDLNSNGWHTISNDGEPECPLRNDVVLIEI